MKARAFATILTGLAALVVGVSATAQTEAGLAAERGALAQVLRAYPHKIVFETYRDGNWDIYQIDADGSNLVNLTRTPDIDEFYPHASPDGTRMVFLADAGEREERTRTVVLSEADGSNRIKVADNGTMSFWSPDGKTIAYAGPGESSYWRDAYANDGLFFYDVETGKVTQHPNHEISGLLTPCWSADGKWIIASIIRSMGYGESICALEVRGHKVVEIARSRSGPDDLYQCRPDVNPAGNRVAWGKGNTAHKDYFYVETCNLNLTIPEPVVYNKQFAVTVDFPQQTYHVDWSPDGKYICYSQGGMGTRMEPAGYVVGKKAVGWDLWIVDPDEPDVVVKITLDGLSNKEPDWRYVAK